MCARRHLKFSDGAMACRFEAVKDADGMPTPFVRRVWHDILIKPLHALGAWDANTRQAAFKIQDALGLQPAGNCPLANTLMLPHPITEADFLAVWNSTDHMCLVEDGACAGRTGNALAYLLECCTLRGVASLTTVVGFMKALAERYPPYWL